ncbi:hypothetical protein LY625_13305, partial [Lysobacter sp. GX 14042]|uniref:hypothetical protein n=1 Tax=Lysobacter sp. GX 14042 TaxID=2907155 RepID=UPI001F1E80C8
MTRSAALLLILVMLLVGGAETRATPPPVSKPQYCAASFCVEVIAYSFVESAIVDRSNKAERISIRLEDGTRIAFAARAARKDEISGKHGSDWVWRSPSMATSR